MLLQAHFSGKNARAHKGEFRGVARVTSRTCIASPIISPLIAALQSLLIGTAGRGTALGRGIGDVGEIRESPLRAACWGAAVEKVVKFERAPSTRENH